MVWMFTHGPRSLAALACSSALLLGACGGDDGGDAPGADEQSEDAGETETEAETETDTSSGESTETPPSCGGTFEVSGPVGAPGYIYVDDRFTGVEAPGTLTLELGSEHTIAVAERAIPSVDGHYFERTLVIEDSLCELTLDPGERVGPKTWRALWVGVGQAQAPVDGQTCTSQASGAELDAAFADFEWSLDEHFARYTHGTLDWEVVRQDLAGPVALSGAEDFFEIRPGDLGEVWAAVEQGDYDVIVAVWKSRGSGCTIPGNYFGLGWSPQGETKQSGFVTIKFDTDDIASTIAWHHENDPGVWIHEWLHTIGEAFYPNLGAPMPSPGGDGLIVHGAGNYGYNPPWMVWYEHFVSGRVDEGGGEYSGINPTSFAACTVREFAVGACSGL